MTPDPIRLKTGIWQTALTITPSGRTRPGGLIRNSPLTGLLPGDGPFLNATPKCSNLFIFIRTKQGSMKFLDIFFTVFHTCLVLFNLFGWIWKKTRLANLITLLVTAGSWLILGIFYGFGYCPLTDWHFSILEKLGYTNLPDSYLSFLFTRLTGLPVDQGLVDAVTLWGLIIALAISLYLNIRQWFKARRKQNAV